MHIRLEHDEIVKAVTLYIQHVYGSEAMSTIEIKTIMAGEYRDPNSPPSFVLEANVEMPGKIRRDAPPVDAG